MMATRRGFLGSWLRGAAGVVALSHAPAIEAIQRIVGSDALLGPMEEEWSWDVPWRCWRYYAKRSIAGVDYYYAEMIDAGFYDLDDDADRRVIRATADKAFERAAREKMAL